jgi:hypothetical protein
MGFEWKDDEGFERRRQAKLSGFMMLGQGWRRFS